MLWLLALDRWPTAPNNGRLRVEFTLELLEPLAQHPQMTSTVSLPETPLCHPPGVPLVGNAREDHLAEQTSTRGRVDAVSLRQPSAIPIVQNDDSFAPKGCRANYERRFSAVSGTSAVGCRCGHRIDAGHLTSGRLDECPPRPDRIEDVTSRFGHVPRRGHLLCDDGRCREAPSEMRRELPVRAR